MMPTTIRASTIRYRSLATVYSGEVVAASYGAGPCCVRGEKVCMQPANDEVQRAHGIVKHAAARAVDVPEL